TSLSRDWSSDVCSSDLAVGGGVVGLLGQLGTTVGSTAIGPSGWALFPLLQGSQGIGPAIAVYGAGLLTGYVAGFALTYFFGFGRSEERRGGEGCVGRAW